jgi:hypothetical protein
MKTILTANIKTLGETEFVGEHLSLWLRGTSFITEQIVDNTSEVCDEEVRNIIKKALEDIGAYYESKLKKCFKK